MEQIYYGITIVIYGIFIIRFILSWIGGDFELDAGADVDLGDVVSFKGATHFLMGFFGWLSTKLLMIHSLEWYDYLIGFILGIIFVIILFYVYKFMMKLESKPTILSGKNLIGHSAKIYSHSKGKEERFHHYLITAYNGNGTLEYPAISVHDHNINDMVIITDYKDSYYIIN